MADDLLPTVLHGHGARHVLAKGKQPVVKGIIKEEEAFLKAAEEQNKKMEMLSKADRESQEVELGSKEAARMIGALEALLALRNQGDPRAEERWTKLEELYQLVQSREGQRLVTTCRYSKGYGGMTKVFVTLARDMISPEMQRALTYWMSVAGGKHYNKAPPQSGLAKEVAGTAFS